MEINCRHFDDYLRIFGLSKMQFLWSEYLAHSAAIWEKMPDLTRAERERAFHNWRSSSQVFGMDEFARACQQTEERILQHRLAGLDEQIAQNRRLYESSVDEVKALFEEKEQHD